MDLGSRGPRLLLLATLLVVLPVAPGCKRPELPASLEPSFGRFVARDPVYVLPGREWSGQEDHWRFHAQGTLHVYVAGPVEEPLVIEVPLDERTRLYTVRAVWDGEVLAPDPGPAPVAGSWNVQVGPERLTPGLHELVLERDYGADARQVRGARPETEVDEVRVAQGGRSWTLDPATERHYSYLASFLLQRIAGLGQELLGGILVHGPGAWEQDLSPRPGSRVELTVENASDAPASFRIETDRGVLAEVAVPPGERRPLRATPGERDRLVFAVTGERDGLFLFGEPFVVGPEPGERPSLIVVTLDTTRRDFVAPWDPDAPTPNLAAFAETATVFDRAYATSPWTLPSHASIFTGLWPGEHRASLEEPHLPFGHETLPERLRQAGYFTAGYAGGFLAHHRFGLGQGMHRYRDPEAFETRGDRLTDTVLSFLEEKEARPLFLFVNYFDPHAPYQASEPWEESVAEKAALLRERRVWGGVTRGEAGALAAAIRGEGGFDQEVRAYLDAAYRAEVAFMDHQLGRLFQSLREVGLWDESLIVLVADHGELLGEDGHFTHAHRLDPELVEIPLMVKWPGQTEGTRVGALVSQVDLFPTLLRAARLRVPDGQRGLLLHRESDRNLERRRRVFMEEHDTAPHPLFPELKVADDLYAVQELELRQVLWEEERRCFRRSEAGRWGEEPCPEGRELSLAQLEALLGHDRARETGERPLTPEEEEGLKALGYL